MRQITVRIDNALLDEAQDFARLRGRSLDDLVDDALRAFLARQPGIRQRMRMPLPTSGGGGLQPGVGLDASATLRDIMDGTDPEE